MAMMLDISPWRSGVMMVVIIHLKGRWIRGRIGCGVSALGRASGIRVFIEGMTAAFLSGPLAESHGPGARLKAELTRRFLHDSHAL